MAILCVSRQFSCGAEDISRQIAQDLGYDYVDKTRLAHDLGDFGEKWKELLTDRDESCPTIWERYDKGYKAMVCLVEAKIYEYASKDKVVIVGRGSHILLGDLTPVLRVRFFAPDWKRVEIVMQRDDMDRTTAEWLIRKVDRDKACYIQANYGKSLDDPKEFDLVFDTSEHSADHIVEVVRKALQHKDEITSEETWQRLRTLALAALVKARVATDPRVFVPTLEVQEQGGALVLLGVVHSEKEMKLVTEIAQGAASNVPVVNRLRFRIA